MAVVSPLSMFQQVHSKFKPWNVWINWKQCASFYTQLALPNKLMLNVVSGQLG